MQRLGIDDLQCVLRAARNSIDAAAEPWKAVTGPGHAFLLTCMRIWWLPLDGHRLILTDGRVLNLTRVPPIVVKR